MEKTVKYSYRLSDDDILRKIGEFVRHHRLERNISQADLAHQAGINRTTLSDLELGRRSQLLTLIQVLRILDQLHVFDEFHVSPQISPIKLAEMELKKRKRASGGDQNKEASQSDW